MARGNFRHLKKVCNFCGKKAEVRVKHSTKFHTFLCKACLLYNKNMNIIEVKEL